MRTVISLMLVAFLLSLAHSQSAFHVSNKTSGDTLLSINNEGKLGIRITKPEVPLHIGMNSAGYWQQGIRIINPGLESGNQLMMTFGYQDGPNNAANVYFTYDGAGSENNRLTLGLHAVDDVLNILANGRVGIGTAMPLAKFDVRGITPDEGVTFSVGNSDLSHQILLFPGRENDPNPFIRWKAGDPLRFSTDEGGWSEKMRIAADGNVGIGTDNPQAKLEVAGTIRSTSGGFMFPDNSVQTTAASGGGASEINDLSDGKTGGNSVFLGSEAGANDDGSTNNNTAVGTSALNATTTGSYNAALGHGALQFNTTGERNVGIGQAANMRNQTGSYNTAIGFAAGGGSSLHSKSGNVFIGYMAGVYENGDNKLYIENSDSDTPLIGGDFATNQVDLNGEVYVRNRLGVGTTTPGAGMHVVGSGFPNSFLYLESETGGDAGIRLYEGTTDKWHIFNNVGLDGLHIYNDVGQTAIFADQTTTNVGIGTTTPASKLDVRGNVTVRDPNSGDIVIELGTGLDYAEGFDVSNKDDIGLGTVLCIDAFNPGKLKISEEAYDRTVAGIVAGANQLGSGITLGSGRHDFNVALAGRVYCNVDATRERVNPGDLLTTSDLPGYAQKVTDYQKSQGAILGKAMQHLEKGHTGQILVLVTLQ